MIDRGILEALRGIVGAEHVITEPAQMAPYGIDRTTLWVPAPGIVARPAGIDQVQQIVQLAYRANIAIVPSGGRTGYSGGAVAANGEMVLSLERMNRILHYSEADQSVTCEAGVITGHLQQYAEEKGLFYPVSLASEGSCHIGGNVATNAGGIHVIRYGGTREQVLGLKVVTGEGVVLELNRGLVKNNCGPDLRHLFIGSEGILGVICEVTLKLSPAPPPQTVILLGAERLTDFLAVLGAARSEFNLSAFEFFTQAALEKVMAHTGARAPFERSADVYGLLEFDTPSSEEIITGFFERCATRGWAVDGVVARSIQQAKSLWQLRENISESLYPFKPYKNDIAVTLENLPGFISRMEERIGGEFAAMECIWFGHVGDGNIHLNLLPPKGMGETDYRECSARVAKVVLQTVSEFDGSISAEHGIGLLKKDYLGFGLAAEEVAILEQMRGVFDPGGILNPGKIF